MARSGAICPSITALGAAEFRRVERVPGGLLHVDVTRDRRDGDHAHVGGAQGHDQGDGIVGSGISIDQEGARHGGSIANACLIRCEACAKLQGCAP